MALISNIDKKIWYNYVSNLERIVIIPTKKDTVNLKNKNRNKNIFNKKSVLNNSRVNNRRYTKPDGIIDLHGYNLRLGKIALSKYIFHCYEKNIRNILIVTGKGFNNKGAFKEEVPKWLNENILKKYLVNFNIAPKQFGGEGALLARIKNKYKNQY